MQPIVFDLSEARCVRGRGLGVGPSFQGLIPLPAIRRVIAGVSRDSTGAVLGGCTCTLFRVNDDGTFSQVDAAISDASTGAFSFSVGLAQNYRVTFDLAGAPDRAGISAKNLVGDAEGS